MGWFTRRASEPPRPDLGPQLAELRGEVAELSDEVARLRRRLKRWAGSQAHEEEGAETPTGTGPPGRPGGRTGLPTVVQLRQRGLYPKGW